MTEDVKVYKPSKSFVSSANQRPVNNAYPYYVIDDFYESYRNRVINQFFSSKDTFDIQDFKDLHNNDYYILYTSYISCNLLKK